MGRSRLDEHIAATYTAADGTLLANALKPLEPGQFVTTTDVRLQRELDASEALYLTKQLRRNLATRARERRAGCR